MRESASDGNAVIFIHVPKCGGTSIRTAFRRAIALHGLNAASLDEKASTRAAEALNDDPLALRERWMLYQVASARVAYIDGHFPWSPALGELAGNYRVVTMLREPRSHFLSTFFYNRDKASRAHLTIDPGTTLREFVGSDRARAIGAMFVRYFTDPHLRSVPTKSDAINAACRNLMTVDVVGTLDQVDDWADDVGQLIGRRLKIGNERVSPTPLARRDAEIDAEVLGTIDEICRPNRAVYEAARGWRANQT